MWSVESWSRGVVVVGVVESSSLPVFQSSCLLLAFESSCVLLVFWASMLLVGGRGLVLSVEEVLSREARTGDVAAPVVWWACASGRGVPERVRRPREKSGPGATTLTVVGEGLTGHKREVPTFLSGFCMHAVAPCPTS